jgi:glucoamylase
MSITHKKILISALLLLYFSFTTTGFAAAKSKTVVWLDTKSDFAVKKILENISPGDGLPGAVLAAKSRSEPDYYYHWVRDAALTMSALIDIYQTSANVEIKNIIHKTVFDYLDFSIAIQHTLKITDLGEPKFYVTGHVYNKPWGRPQTDGPALRAISLIHWANILIDEGQENTVRQKLYNSKYPANSPIKIDLEYISHHWKEPSFDIWEEVKGTHFYTLMVIRRALLEGTVIANHVGDAGAAKWYHSQAKEIEHELQNFWDPEKGYITATINRVEGLDYKISNLDISVLLGLLHGNMNDGFFSWNHPHVKATVKKIMTAFKDLYPINQHRDIPGLALGRYPEDRYGGNNFDGGNPWPLCTLAFAEVLYEYANLVKHHGQLSLALQVSRQADQFVERVKYHSYADDALDEQIDRHTGYMTSARDLTWNYAALLTTRRAAIQ